MHPLVFVRTTSCPPAFPAVADRREFWQWLLNRPAFESIVWTPARIVIAYPCSTIVSLQQLRLAARDRIYFSPTLRLSDSPTLRLSDFPTLRQLQITRRHLRYSDASLTSFCTRKQRSPSCLRDFLSSSAASSSSA